MTQPRHEPLAHLALAGRATGNAESAAVVLRALPYHPSLILRGAVSYTHLTLPTTPYV